MFYLFILGGWKFSPTLGEQWYKKTMLSNLLIAIYTQKSQINMSNKQRIVYPSTVNISWLLKNQHLKRKRAVFIFFIFPERVI